MLQSGPATALRVVLICLVVAACITQPSQTRQPSTQPSNAPTPAASAPPGLTPTPGTTSAPGSLEGLAVSLLPFAHVDGGPLAIAAPNDGTARLFVAAQDGQIWVLAGDGSLPPELMVDLSGRLRSGGEQGLLGLALHPRFPDDPRVFVSYTNKDGDSVIASLTLARGDPNRLDPGSQRSVLFLRQPFANHNGGDVKFGPDGYLYAFFGDGGGGGDPEGNGQDRTALLGKVLRLDIDRPEADRGYSSPPDNPFVDGVGRDEVWLMGMRNPWRNSFDRATGDLWIGDVGQGAWEEIDVARAGVGGLNFGWNRMEGNHCYPPGSDCTKEGLTPPVTEYGRDLGCTVVGGYVYRGAAVPALAGVYVFADYCSGRIFAIDPRTDDFREPEEVGGGGNGISSFGEDAAGELYVTHLNGDISKVTATR